MRRFLMFAGSIVLVPSLSAAQRSAGTNGPETRSAPPVHVVSAGSNQSVGSSHTQSATHFVAESRTAASGHSYGSAGSVGTRSTTPTGPIQKRANPNEPKSPLSGLPPRAFHHPTLSPTASSLQPNYGYQQSGGAPLSGGYLFFPPTLFVEQPDVTGVVDGPTEETAADDSQDASAANDAGTNAPECRAPLGSHSETAEAAGEAPETAVQEPQAPQYVFVRRDGVLLFAIGYSWERDTLRYITSDGTKKSVTRDSLDLDATKKFNQQLGLIFSIPA